ncbi:unnamed protein product [Clavelina lepadiformis]|uniref:ELMO domain-containing protein n=1 Tax=Clavelina lepadiformis TaxID=159417 RepID=A0ABP0GZM0_CLALP
MDVKYASPCSSAEGGIGEGIDQHEMKETEAKTATDILRTKGLLSSVDNEDNDLKNEEKIAWMKNVDQEKAEWDALDLMKHAVSGVVKAIEDILFPEALQFFQTQAVGSTEGFTKKRRSRVSQLMRLIFGPRRLNKSLHQERDLICRISQAMLNHDEPVHCRVIQTIYKRLIGSKHNCPNHGPHWEVIGFQGHDPATDLRGAGFLALLHLLFLITEHPHVAAEIYQLSTHPVQNFPFCLVSINVTRIALLALREDKLSRICNKRKQVVSVMNEFYLAVFWHIYYVWKNQHKTMNESGHVMKAAEITALKDPAMLMKALNSALEMRRKKLSVVPPTIVLSRLSTASTDSDVSTHSPVLTSQSLDVVLQPVERERADSKTSDPRFAGVLEIYKEEMTVTQREEEETNVTLQL